MIKIILAMSLLIFPVATGQHDVVVSQQPKWTYEKCIEQEDDEHWTTAEQLCGCIYLETSKQPKLNINDATEYCQMIVHSI